jgi:hypothetical protein
MECGALAVGMVGDASECRLRTVVCGVGLRCLVLLGGVRRDDTSR